MMTKYGLVTIMQLKPVTYTCQAEKADQPVVGFIAQKAQKIFPEVVNPKKSEGAKGETLCMSYNNLVLVLTKALQELKE